MNPLTWTIGDVRITRVLEREVPTPIAGLIPAATPAALAPHLHWLAPDFIDADATHCKLSLHALVIESGALRIVVDTCIGEHRAPGMAVLDTAVEPFLGNLRAAGFERTAIDVVLCTHLHFDHVGWHTMRRDDAWVPTFPNARYLFARREWEHWRDSPDRHAWTLYDETVAPVIDAGLAEFVATDHVLDDAVRLLSTPGHTPGHVSVLVESGGERALITGDMTHHPVQWAQPDWHTVADVDAAQGSQTRRDLLRDYCDDPHTLIIGTHYPTPCAGYLRNSGAHAVLQTARRR